MTPEQWKLEEELQKVNHQCSINSGMGERYEYWHNKQKGLIVQLAAHRTLTVYEVLCLDFGYEFCLNLIRTQSEPTLDYQGTTIRMKREINRISHEGKVICEGCQGAVPAIEIIDGRCAICREKERGTPDDSDPWGNTVVCDVCGTRYAPEDFCMTCYLRAQERAAGCVW